MGWAQGLCLELKGIKGEKKRRRPNEGADEHTPVACCRHATVVNAKFLATDTYASSNLTDMLLWNLGQRLFGIQQVMVTQGCLRRVQCGQQPLVIELRTHSTWQLSTIWYQESVHVDYKHVCFHSYFGQIHTYICAPV